MKTKGSLPCLEDENVDIPDEYWVEKIRLAQKKGFLQPVVFRRGK